MKKIFYKEFEIIRAIAVILVVLGHSFINGPQQSIFLSFIIKFIYSFHMPVFFFISGFFALKIYKLNKEKKIQFIQGKFIRLIIPYVSLSLVAIPIKLLLNTFVKRPLLLNEILENILIYPQKNPVSSLWFIYVLFFIFLIVISLSKLTIKKLFYCSLITMLIFNPFKIEMFYLNAIFNNLPFFILGLLIRENYPNVYSFINNNKYIVFLVSLSLLLIENYFTMNFFSNKLLSHFFTGITGIIMMLSLSYFIPYFRLFSLINKFSYDIYLLSWFTQNIIGYFMFKILFINYFYVVVITFLCGFLPIFISKFYIKKNKLLSFIFLGIK
ncbi:acyltransferase family protein [Turicibacter sanguinis]|uniref:acyltransferase family protein n=1 Tax=Turicibacter sanguinis TaxID=154288 RepID=UPI0018ABE8D9|nr:acyltransferase [Turicibacter sanguinis]MDB8567896.1 acyltransferase [Turicibacter sanguinis]MDB8570645.1 acyltransferase [Turicibacter sanguinis]MDB8573398.1 acyltransferase [Turicibacter sanguinis]MDB8582158.1 acyltransferase [Turicibacter sanguinis]